jgi:predicted RNA-binding protein with RPS1 domain
VVRGKVSRFTSFGVFVELGEGLEGLCHISELSDERVERPEDVVQLGQEADFRILRIENADQKIGLSYRAVGKDDEPIVDSRIYTSEAKGGMASLGELANLMGRGEAKEAEPEMTKEEREEAKRLRKEQARREYEEAAAREAAAAEAAPTEEGEAPSNEAEAAPAAVAETATEEQPTEATDEAASAETPAADPDAAAAAGEPNGSAEGDAATDAAEESESKTA